MTDLQQQARGYADTTLKRYQGISLWKVDAHRLIAQAYIQGYVDCDTRDMKFETKEEYLDCAPDCAYFGKDGECLHLLPDIAPCQRAKCLTYIKKEQNK